MLVERKLESCWAARYQPTSYIGLEKQNFKSAPDFLSSESGLRRGTSAARSVLQGVCAPLAEPLEIKDAWIGERGADDIYPRINETATISS